MSQPPSKSRLKTRVHSAPLLKQLGPGLITGAADDDPSGIATYSQGGAWTFLIALLPGLLLAAGAFYCWFVLHDH